MSNMTTHNLLAIVKHAAEPPAVPTDITIEDILNASVTTANMGEWIKQSVFPPDERWMNSVRDSLDFYTLHVNIYPDDNKVAVGVPVKI